MNEVKVSFDLTKQSAPTEGTLTLKDGVLSVTADGCSKNYSLKDVKEAVQYTDIGCGRLELVKNGAKDDGSENILICRFSMSLVYEIGEFVKVLNHFLTTG